ncbi:MAG: hypothetical protein GY795_14690 [Desulfobacterales bacterium]|nr:hypothetical protein [Desulfobacterales bacterium]
MSLSQLFLVIFMLAILNTVLGGLNVKIFISRNNTIDSIVIERFKKMVRIQMYQALLQIILLGGTLLIGIYGIFTEEISLFKVLLLNGIILGLSLAFRPYEERARNMEVEDESLQKEYLEICNTWINKPFPDF